MNKIPFHLHQTWKSKEDLIQGGKFYNNIKSWFEGNQGLEYSFYSDEEMYLFVKENYLEYYELFLSLPLMVEKADLFRYFVLYKYGGVYSDIDIYCIKPIKKWTEESCNILLSMETKKENIRREYSLYARENTVCQWTLASIPNHPFFELLIKRCIQRIESWPLEKTNFSNRPKYIQKAMETVERTGPGLMTDVFLEWNAQKNNSKNILGGGRFDDMIILPPYSFGKGLEGKGHKREYLYPKHMCVHHQFMGSWWGTQKVVSLSTKTHGLRLINKYLDPFQTLSKSK